ncbi:MAG: hypothetical protein II937_10515 [Bacteroidales bacterium]|nr:hypothetical protein [Bacteroidales bacterium]
MKKTIFIISALLTIFFSTCDDSKVVNSDNESYYYNDEKDCNCNPKLTNLSKKPDSAFVTFRVTINEENPEVKIIVLNGNFSSGKEIDSLSTKHQRDSLRLLLGTTYTYVAKYKKGNDSIAVPVCARLFTNSNDCKGLLCYEIINNVIDLSLKF